MSTLSRSQVAQLAANAGIPSSQINTAVAIAQAESGFRTDAVNHNTNGSTDTGLWQINSVHGYSSTSLKDPTFNAQAMAKISNGGTNWTPWTTYKTGAYKRYLSGDSVPTSTSGSGVSASGADASGITPALQNPLNTITGGNWSRLEGLVTELTNVAFWQRVGMAAGGIALIILSISLFASQTKAGKAAIGVASKVAVL